MTSPEQYEDGRDHDLEINKQGHAFHIQKVVFQPNDHLIHSFGLTIFYLSPGSNPGFELV